jgi:hypothetical protein
VDLSSLQVGRQQLQLLDSYLSFNKLLNFLTLIKVQNSSRLLPKLKFKTLLHPPGRKLSTLTIKRRQNSSKDWLKKINFLELPFSAAK